MAGRTGIAELAVGTVPAPTSVSASFNRPIRLFPPYRPRVYLSEMAARKFGTDGSRGIIAEDFTFANARTVTEAIARYGVCGEEARKCGIRGYDHRYASDTVQRP